MEQLSAEQRKEEIEKLLGQPIEQAEYWAKWGLGIRDYVPADPNHPQGNAFYAIDGCDNVNLHDEDWQVDGFCDHCGRFHYKVYFGKRTTRPEGWKIEDGGYTAMMMNDIGGKFPLNLGIGFAGTSSTCDFGEDASFLLDTDIEIGTDGFDSPNFLSDAQKKAIKNHNLGLVGLEPEKEPKKRTPKEERPPSPEEQKKAEIRANVKRRMIEAGFSSIYSTD